MAKTTKIIVAYVAGQITQLVVHAIALNLWNSQQIPFCIAGGFVIFFALISGVFIARNTNGEHEEHKSYLDWAKIPWSKDESEQI